MIVKCADRYIRCAIYLNEVFVARHDFPAHIIPPQVVYEGDSETLSLRFLGDS